MEDTRLYKHLKKARNVYYGISTIEGTNKIKEPSRDLDRFEDLKQKLMGNTREGGENVQK